MEKRHKLVILAIATTAMTPSVVAAQESSSSTGTTTSPQTAPQAQNDSTIADIVVTADRSAKTLQKTPIAVSVVTGSEISTMGRSKIDDVLQNVPAVIVQGAAKGFLISIRGLGDDLPAQNGQASVSQNFDGVYNFRSESNSVGFFDLDRVEILRGPQGTLYGRNASGGVVNVISADPKLGEYSGYGVVEAGNYNLLRGEAAVNAAVSDTVAFRAAFAAVHREGYLSNGHDDNKAVSGRVKLLFKPNADFSLLLGAEYSKLGGKGPGGTDYANFAAGDHYLTSDTGVGSQNFRSWKFWAFLTARIGPGVFTVLPAYQTAHARALGAFGGNFSDAGDPKLARQKSVEARYASPAGEPLQWNVGYYHYDSKNVGISYETPCQDVSIANGGTGGVFIAPDGYTYKGNGPPGLGSCRPEPVKAYYQPQIDKLFTDAVFGQITYPIMDTLRVIGGARYSWDRGSQQQSGGNDVTVPAPTVYDRFVDRHFEYRAGVEFDVLPRSLLYATVARGHRTGGFNFNNSPYGPERLTSYELGLKNRFLDNRLQINGDVFYYDYKGFQLTTFGINPATGQVSPYFVNLSKARDYGAELESQFRITPADDLNLSVVYLNTKLQSDAPGSFSHYDGERFPHSPKWTIKGGYSHTFDLGDAGKLIPRVDVRHLSSQFVKPVATDDNAATLDEATQRAYTTGDFSLLFTAASGRWSANFYVKNFNQKAIKSSDFFGYVQVQAPRTYGGTLTVRF